MSTAPSRNHTATADEIDLGQLWAIVRDGRKYIVLFSLLGLILGLVYLLLAQPIYRADALLQVEKKQGGLALLGGLEDLVGQEGAAQTEIEIIRSRMVLQAAIRELGADIAVTPERTGFWGTLFGESNGNQMLFSGWARDGEVVWVETLALERHLQGEELLLEVTEQGFDLYWEGQLLAQGRVGEDIVLSGYIRHLKIRQLNAEPGRRFYVQQQNELEAVRSVLNSLGVSERGRNTGILSLSLTGTHTGRVEALLNAIAHNYFLQNVKRRSEEAEKSLAFLDEQVPSIKTDLERAEEKLNDYRLKSESVDLTLETKAVLDRLVTLEASLTELQMRESEVANLYTREHPTYQTLLKQRESFEKERERLNDQVKELPETQQEILRLMRDVELNQQIYVQLLGRSQELRILKAGTVGNVRIIDEARVQMQPVKPKKPLVAALATLLGLMAGLAYTFLSLVFNKRIESAEEIENEGFQVYATLPESEQQAKYDASLRKKNKRGNKQLVPLLAQEMPTDLAVEALRSFRTSLHFVMMGTEAKVLMVSGASPGAGKSFVSANLAAVLAAGGKRVILIDADLRKGTLHRYYAAEQSQGLSGVLSGSTELEQAIVQTTQQGLHFIPRGEVPPNPAELLMQPQLERLLKKLSDDYDIVLVDTPPILAVTDAAIVGQYATAGVMVVRYGVNSVREVARAFDAFEKNGVQMKGAILNAAKRTARNADYYYAYEYK